MGGGGTFMPILCIAGFLSAVWCAGRVSKFIGVSSVVLEILTGLLLAPGVLLENGLLDVAGGHNAEIFILIGHAGVAMMIFESGMHFDFHKAKEVGPWACVVAVLGTCLPLGVGMFLTRAFGSPIYPDGVAVGVSLAPTSVGIALQLLMEAKCLQKDFGQAIITAAFVDDILSLIAFNILFSITSGPHGPFCCCWQAVDWHRVHVSCWFTGALVLAARCKKDLGNRNQGWIPQPS